MAPQKQHAVVVTSTNADKAKTYDNLELQERDVPELQDGQVLVRITLRPVNPTEGLQITGYYGHQAPFVPGSEGVGVVEELGPGTSGRLAKGQRVVSADWGLASWQEYAAIDEKFLVGVPDDINDEVAAQTFITTLTVIGLVETAAVPKGEWLLQTAAASGLGRQVIQYAKSRGIKTINVVRRGSQKAELEALGADAVIDSSAEDFVARVKEITGGAGAYSAIDPVSGDTTGKVLEAVRQGGAATVYGALAGPALGVQVFQLFGKTLNSFIIYSWLPSHGPEKARALFDDAFKLFQDGVLSAHPGKRYPLAEYKKAFEASVAPGRSAESPKVFLES
jgi:NADPH:quinone reductase-like Zn-dependent oxidoreductase